MHAVVVPAPRPPRSPARLADLGLEPAELRELSQQGFVAKEQRGRCQLFKLRFRCGGKQRARYLGTNAAAAAAISNEVLRLQRRWLRRVEEKLWCRAQQLRRLGRKQLAAPLAALGYHYHGMFVRRYRDGGHGDCYPGVARLVPLGPASRRRNAGGRVRRSASLARSAARRRERSDRSPSASACSRQTIRSISHSRLPAGV